MLGSLVEGRARLGGNSDRVYISAAFGSSHAMQPRLSVVSVSWSELRSIFSDLLAACFMSLVVL